MVLFAPTGDQLNLLVWTSPITTAAGKLIQILVIFADVTELRRLQDNLSQLGLMISTITHSLKGSLTGLDAGLYMIDKGFYRNRPGRIEEGLDVAKLMTERIRKVVRDILYYAKERRLETEKVDAGQFAADVASSIQTKILGADIKFSTRIDPGAGVLEIDTGLIRASLINILENAVEACIEDESKESHWIEFSVTGERDHVVFGIDDNGVGMEPGQVQNIFKLFWSSNGKKGTGLGLFITNKVIQKHGGKIAVDSHPDTHTTFRVHLPRKVNT
jgi:signal transduction histidine kinase